MTDTLDTIRVVTACTALKTKAPGAAMLKHGDFERGADTITAWHESHPDWLRPAERLYRGQHHVRLMRGVQRARQAGLDVRLSVVSAGYGVVDGDALIAPYEATFQGLGVRERRAWARRLGIPVAIQGILATERSLTVVLLGDDYLDASGLAEARRVGARTLVFCAPGSALRLPPIADLRPIVLRTEDTRRFGCGLVGLKGEVGGRLMSVLAERPDFGAYIESAVLLEALATHCPPRVESSHPAATLF